MIKNSYLDIAENDLRYLESVLETGSTFYNQMSVQCQQVAEKFLKGYVDRLFLNEDVSDLLRKHNMKKIFTMMQGIRVMIFTQLQRKNLISVYPLCTIQWRS